MGMREATMGSEGICVEQECGFHCSMEEEEEDALSAWIRIQEGGGY